MRYWLYRQFINARHWWLMHTSESYRYAYHLIKQDAARRIQQAIEYRLMYGISPLDE